MKICDEYNWQIIRVCRTEKNQLFWVETIEIKGKTDICIGSNVIKSTHGWFRKSFNEKLQPKKIK